MVEGIQGTGYPLRVRGELPGLRDLGAPSTSGTAGPAGLKGATESSPTEANASFGSTLKQFVGGVNDMQLRSDQLFQAFVRGEATDLHQVALAQQEAGIALRLVTEMRDKLLMAYQEVMRTQM